MEKVPCRSLEFREIPWNSEKILLKYAIFAQNWSSVFSEIQRQSRFILQKVRRSWKICIGNPLKMPGKNGEIWNVLFLWKSWKFRRNQRSSKNAEKSGLDRKNRRWFSRERASESAGMPRHCKAKGRVISPWAKWLRKKCRHRSESESWESSFFLLLLLAPTTSWYELVRVSAKSALRRRMNCKGSCLLSTATEK